MNYQPSIYAAKRLTGRLASGHERGGGRLYHAVPEHSEWGRALCGAKPVVLTTEEVQDYLDSCDDLFYVHRYFGRDKECPKQP